MKISEDFMITILSIVILGFVIIVVVGNLGTSSGFATGSLGANQTADLTANVSTGVTSFFSNTTTWFSLLSIVIIIAIVIIVARIGRGAGGGKNV